MKPHALTTIVSGTFIVCLCVLLISLEQGFPMELDDTKLTRLGPHDGSYNAWGTWDATAWKAPSDAVGSTRRGHPFSLFLPFRVLAIGMVHFFQRYISPVDGPTCSFYPTCSAYGIGAIEKHGLLIGIPMTAERVMRNHRVDDVDRYTLIEIHGSLYYFDPVGANDFWWQSGRAREKLSQ